MLTRGKFFWKKQWYSICSSHREYDKNCPRCNVGSWRNVYYHYIDSFIHDHFYKIWFWYKNINSYNSLGLERLTIKKVRIEKIKNIFNIFDWIKNKK